jgi:hypothetical protein
VEYGRMKEMPLEYLLKRGKILLEIMSYTKGSAG